MTKRSETAEPNARRAAAWLKEQSGPMAMPDICAAFGWSSQTGIAAMKRAAELQLVWFQKPTSRERRRRGGWWMPWENRPPSVPAHGDDDGPISTNGRRSWGAIPALCVLFGLVPRPHARPESVITHRGFSGPQRDMAGGQ